MKTRVKCELHNCDALAAIAEMPDACVDLVLTDPPYKVISGGHKHSKKLKVNRGILVKNDGKLFKHNNVKVQDWMPHLYRVLKPGREAYIMTNNLNLQDYLNAAAEAGFKFHGLLIWQKNTSNMSRWYRPDSEYTLFFYKPPARTINNPGSKRIFFAPNPRNKLHPTQKPVALFKHYITNSTEPGWLVLDPFAGVGTTALACLASGRRFIGYEIDSEYYKIAQRRIKKKLGK